MFDQTPVPERTLSFGNLMQMGIFLAKELDLTMIYHRRYGQVC